MKVEIIEQEVQELDFKAGDIVVIRSAYGSNHYLVWAEKKSAETLYTLINLLGVGRWQKPLSKETLLATLKENNKIVSVTVIPHDEAVLQIKY